MIQKGRYTLDSREKTYKPSASNTDSVSSINAVFDSGTQGGLVCGWEGTVEAMGCSPLVH